MVYQDCNRCKHESKDSKESPCDKCSMGEREGYEPKTNADRIRNMTDEELADFIEMKQFFALANNGTDGEEYTLEWLQAEVKEGNSNDT